MNRQNRLRIILITAVIFIALFAVCTAILMRNDDRHFEDSAVILSSQIKNYISTNEKEKSELQKSLKEEYVSRARSLAYILEKTNGLEEDYDELCRVAKLLDIDEINVFGQDGLIAYSTVKEYVGFSIYSGGQIAFFEPMMTDHTLELCQDVTPNTKEGKLIMYAAVWRTDGDSIIQVGITPEHLLESLERNDISKVLTKMPVDNSMYFIYDKTTEKIVSSTDLSLIVLAENAVAVDEKAQSNKIRKIDHNGKAYVFMMFDYNNYKIGICESRNQLYKETQSTATILFVVLATLLVGVDLLIFFLTNKQQKSEKKFVDELQGFADQLSSYKQSVLSDALIALEVNLSKDELYYGVWKDDNSKVVSLKEIIDLEMPCSYDKYIKIWNERFVKRDATDPFSGSTDRQHLLDVFKSGKNEITFDYEAKTISGRSTWLRRNICMTKNQAGDIIAYTNVKDISALVEQKEREETYVRALATEYDSIAVVRFTDKPEEDNIFIHSRIADDFAKLIDDETLNEMNFGKRLDLLKKYVHPEDREMYREGVRRTRIIESFLQNKLHTVDFRMMTPEGEYIYYQERFIPLKDDDGTLIGLIACLRNTDEEIRKELSIRKTLEDAMIAAESANRAKSAFLFNMSHDIRTPMNAIIGFTDIAQKHIDDKMRVEESLGKVKTASEHLLSLINDVLDMSRVESGQVKIEEEPVFIDTAKENLYSILAGSAESKNLILTMNIAPSLTHHWVYTDRLRLMRVLTNIVSNSVKYTNPGGRIDLTIEELPSEKEGYAHLRYTVADTGIGMSEEFLCHIFEPFSRAESATKSGVVGTGLGMAITKSLAELMGGIISIESKLGEGTTVRIDFENRIAEAIDEGALENDTVKVDLNGKKILLVEDNELNREIATEILEEEGIVIDIAEDGDIAVEKMRNAAEGQYDLILMDVQMPRMNGYEATKAIRTLGTAYAEAVPIIAMTANAFDEDKKNAFDAGMNGHIAKPIEVAKLLGTLEEILKK